MKFHFKKNLVPRSSANRAFEPERRFVDGVAAGRMRGSNRARGVALVITLILLAVITTLAIAFLALTYRETASVDSMGRTTDAELAADAALERVKGEILTPFPRRNAAPNANGSEFMGPDFFVSVISTNVADTNRLDPTNMFFNPSPPVFVDTNRANTSGPLEDRFYHDLNRNDYFEETGFVPDTLDARNGAGKFQYAIGPDGKNIINWRVGDPQWVGILQRPGEPHGPNNRFIARYAFLVQPIGRSLDVNWAHNQALDLEMREASGFNGYFRNQGVGSWELNLAGFLADINTNYWGFDDKYYNFDPFNNVLSGVATGPAFDDARELLRYRYSPRYFNGTPWNLGLPQGSAQVSNHTMNVLVPMLAGAALSNYVDLYADGPLAPLHAFDRLGTNENPSLRWSGGESWRHYSSIHDFFDAAKLPEPAAPGLGFRKKLGVASSLGNSYDRYTYYRMLAQMGTDSAPEDEGKVNINYMNIRSWLTGEQILATDAIPWTSTNKVFVARLNTTVDMGRPGPELFFLTVVTNLLLREPDLAFIVTNARPFSARNDPFGIPLRIPVFTNGSTFTTNGAIPGPLYSGRVHQILQLAANIYDATRAGVGPAEVAALPADFPRLYPTVFRPQFEEISGNVYVTNYVLAEAASKVINNPNRAWHDLDVGEPASAGGGLPQRPVKPDDGVYGVPLIVGARKGYPNFNEFAVRTTVRAIRRLHFFRLNDNAPILTNQTFVLNVANQIGVEARNAYQNPFPRMLDLYFGIRSRSIITNSAFGVFASSNLITGSSTQYLARSWRGTRAGEAPQFRVPPILDQSVLNFTNVTALDPGDVTNQWGMTMTNRMLFYLVDHDADQIVDAVSLNGPRTYFDITAEMTKDLPGKEGTVLGQMWNPARDPNKGTSWGITHQITASTFEPETRGPNEWTDFNADTKSRIDAINELNAFLQRTTAGSNQAGFTPVRRMMMTNHYQVNDPLVHYTMEDLEVTTNVATLKANAIGADQTNFFPLILGSANPVSIPWNNGSGSASASGSGALDASLRDPGIIDSDRWEFPTNQFPNIGWLGRVHRGTPWQTVYLKSKVANGAKWHTHSGNSRAPASANLMHPTNDWRLLDIFTTAPHPNAARGRLSINQTNPAAWSAVLSGVVLTKAVNDPGLGWASTLNTNVVVAPAAPALDNGLSRIIEGINTARKSKPFGLFKHVGDVLAAPELTFDSPFLNSPDYNTSAVGGQEDVFDSDYERIPQQIASLLKVGEPRFVVYAWGQSLKPARTSPEGTGPSIVTAGDWKGLCRNYQITGELAVRAVVRVDFERDPATGLNDYRKPHAVVESYSIVPVE